MRNKLIWAAMLLGIVLSTTVLATGWVAQTPGTTNHLYGVNFINETTGFAVGAGGTVLKTTDRGASWTSRVVGAPTYTWYAVSFPTSSTGYIAGDKSGTDASIYKTTDGGSTWNAVGATFDPSSFRAIHFSSVSIGAAGGIYNNITQKNISYYDSSNNAWANTLAGNLNSSPDIYGINFYSATGYAVGPYKNTDDEGLYKSIDSGANWTAVNNNPADQDMHAVQALSATTAWAVGEGDTILRTTDGSTWPQITGATGNFRGVSFYDPDNGWVVGQLGKIWRITNGSAAAPSLTAQTSGTTATLEDVSAIDQYNAWAVGGGSADILKYVVDPTVAASPDARYAGWSGSVTLTGTNFQSDAVVTVAKSGGTGFDYSYTRDSSTRITVTATLSAAVSTGDWTITVTNGDTGSGSGTFTVNPKPTVKSANPSTLTQGTSGNVEIAGTGFQSGLTASDVVFSLAGVTVNTVTVNGANSITVNLTVADTAATGAGDITVTNPDGGAGTGTGVFSVNTAGVTGPSITSVSPDSGIQGATLDVTITGSNFHAGPPTVVFGDGDITINSTTYNSSTSLGVNITISATAPTTSRTLTITNIDDSGVGSLSNAFTVVSATAVAPTITSISPPSGYAGGTSYFIKGAGFLSGATAYFSPAGNIIVNKVDFVSSTGLRLDLTIPSQVPAGKYDLIVTNPDGGSGALTNGFEVKTQTAEPQIDQQRGLANPNPWNPLTGPLNLQFLLTKASQIKLSFFKINGEKLNEIILNGVAGYNKVSWNGVGLTGHVVPEGIFLVNIMDLARNKRIGTIKVMVHRYQ